MAKNANLGRPAPRATADSDELNPYSPPLFSAQQRLWEGYKPSPWEITYFSVHSTQVLFIIVYANQWPIQLAIYTQYALYLIFPFTLASVAGLSRSLLRSRHRLLWSVDLLVSCIVSAVAISDLL